MVGFCTGRTRSVFYRLRQLWAHWTTRPQLYHTEHKLGLWHWCFLAVQGHYCLLNPLMGTENYSATANNMKLVHWPLMGGMLHLVQRGGDWAGPQPAQAPHRCTKCNSPPISGQCTNTVLLYNGPLLCGFNVPITGWTSSHAVAERPRDASCLSLVSFSSTIRRAQSSVISYFCFRLTAA